MSSTMLIAFLSGYDIAALAGYFVLITFLGVWMARGVKQMSDFVMPRKFGKTMMVLFGFGAGTHSDQAVSVAQKSYTDGVSGIWYQWLWLFCTPFYWLIAPVMRRFRAITTADVFEARYSRSVSVLFAIVGTIQYVVIIGGMLIGSSAIIDAATEGAIPREWAIPIITVLFVVYGVAGGLSAAIVTDFIQGMLTIVFSFLLLPYILNAVGGMSGLHAFAAESGKDSLLQLVAPQDITTFYIAMISINALIGIVAQPHVLACCGAGRTELDGQVGFTGGNFLKRICTIAWCLIGVAAVAYVARFGSPENFHPKDTFGYVAKEILPGVMPGLLGLFLAGLIASVMSSCDAFMVTTAGLFTENIYKPIFKNRSKRHYLWAARIASIVVVGFGVAFAYAIDDPVKALKIFWKIAPMMGIAFWLGLFWRRMNVFGAWAATCAGFVAWWLSTYSTFIVWIQKFSIIQTLNIVRIPEAKAGEVASPEIWMPWQMMFYLSAGFSAGIIASLLTRSMSRERLDRFYELVRTPVGDDEQEPETPCSLPDGVEPRESRKLIPIPWLEIYVPAPRQWIGFVLCWGLVALLIGVFVWIITP